MRPSEVVDGRTEPHCDAEALDDVAAVPADDMDAEHPPRDAIPDELVEAALRARIGRALYVLDRMDRRFHVMTLLARLQLGEPNRRQLRVGEDRRRQRRVVRPRPIPAEHVFDGDPRLVREIVVPVRISMPPSSNAACSSSVAVASERGAMRSSSCTITTREPKR